MYTTIAIYRRFPLRPVVLVSMACLMTLLLNPRATDAQDQTTTQDQPQAGFIFSNWDRLASNDPSWSLPVNHTIKQSFLANITAYPVLLGVDVGLNQETYPALLTISVNGKQVYSKAYKYVWQRQHQQYASVFPLYAFNHLVKKGDRVTFSLTSIRKDISIRVLYPINLNDVDETNRVTESDLNAEKGINVSNFDMPNGRMTARFFLAGNSRPEPPDDEEPKSMGGVAGKVVQWDGTSLKAGDIIRMEQYQIGVDNGKSIPMQGFLALNTEDQNLKFHSSIRYYDEWVMVPTLGLKLSTDKNDPRSWWVIEKIGDEKELKGRHGGICSDSREVLLRSAATSANNPLYLHTTDQSGGDNGIPLVTRNKGGRKAVSHDPEIYFCSSFLNFNHEAPYIKLAFYDPGDKTLVLFSPAKTAASKFPRYVWTWPEIQRSSLNERHHARTKLYLFRKD